MAMDSTQLGIEMAAATRAIFSAISQTTPVSDAEVDNIWKAAAGTIIDHIKNNAEVVIPAGSSAGTYPVI